MYMYMYHGVQHQIQATCLNMHAYSFGVYDSVHIFFSQINALVVHLVWARDKLLGFIN
jgi:heme exporter protein D